MPAAAARSRPLASWASATSGSGCWKPVRVPPVLTACRSYLLVDPEMLRLLLDSGMNPNLPHWLLTTPLHDVCGRNGRGRPRPFRTECATVLLDAGASISARDEDYRSTPLGWAARNDLPDMVELLLQRGAPTNLPDDPPWATLLARATRRGHGRITEMLSAAGATERHQDMTNGILAVSEAVWFLVIRARLLGD
jgi:ankyrin repeat protein